MTTMQAEMTIIADKVRGVAQEKRVSQEQIAALLGLSRQSVSQRYTAKVAFTGAELFALALEFDVDVHRFFPDRARRIPAPVDSPLTRESAGAFSRSAGDAA